MCSSDLDTRIADRILLVDFDHIDLSFPRRTRYSPHPGEPLHVVLAVADGVVRHVDDHVAARGAVGEQLGHAGHGSPATVDDAVEIDEKEHEGMLAGRKPCICDHLAVSTRRDPLDTWCDLRGFTS